MKTIFVSVNNLGENEDYGDKRDYKIEIPIKKVEEIHGIPLALHHTIVNDKPIKTWAVTEPRTGLAVATNQRTMKAAIEEARRTIENEGLMNTRGQIEAELKRQDEIGYDIDNEEGG